MLWAVVADVYDIFLVFCVGELIWQCWWYGSVEYRYGRLIIKMIVAVVGLGLGARANDIIVNEIINNPAGLGHVMNAVAEQDCWVG